MKVRNLVVIVGVTAALAHVLPSTFTSPLRRSVKQLRRSSTKRGGREQVPSR